MKKLLFILLLTIPFIGFGQDTGYFNMGMTNLYKTNDSGITWTLQNSSPGYGKIHFVNSTTGYYSDGVSLYKTIDSGITWTLQSTPPQGTQGFVISFVNSTTGYCHNDLGLYKTTDSGITWTFQNTLPLGNLNFRIIFFVNSTTGYCHIDLGLYKTTDSGITWTFQNTLPLGNLSSMSFVNSTTGYLSMVISTNVPPTSIYKTTDSGNTWTLQNSNIHINDISFVNSTTGYGDQNGNIYKTSNSGVNWTLLYVFPLTESYITFVSNNTTSTFNIPNPSTNKELEKEVDILGRETKPQTNTLFIEIYDDGSTEKKIVVE